MAIAGVVIGLLTKEGTLVCCRCLGTGFVVAWQLPVIKLYPNLAKRYFGFLAVSRLNFDFDYLSFATVLVLAGGIIKYCLVVIGWAGAPLFSVGTACPSGLAVTIVG